jgi:uncharacterized Zn-binding protein involved in type VI secretion
MPQARITDKAICVGPLDVIVKGSATVLVGGLQAARIGDMTAHGGVIVTGCPTVIIGDAPGAAGGAAAPANAGAIQFEGPPADRQVLSEMVETIRNSGPKGKAFIESLEKGPNKTRLFVGKSAEKKNGTVVDLASTGGGVTLRPTESKSGDNEVHVDPTNLIEYRATDGSTVKEKPEGLLLHEMGHAKLLNDKDPAQTTGGADAEKNVRTETNDIRQELGMKPEA